MPISNDLAFASIRMLGQQLRAGKFTSRELSEFFLRRLETLGPKYNAVVTVTRERALQEAARADTELKAGSDRGPLHGIPFGVKDLLATKGIPTSWGAAPFKDQLIDADATVVERLREAGAVLAAKLAMVEIAGGMGYDQANASFTGPGLNPWNTGRWSGGSSSGPGSAVAAGLVPFAIGSETSGSILNPSSFCGITGMRPSYGRVSRHGAMALSWTMDKLGPMCRTADDCGIVLGAIAGPDATDPSAAAKHFRYPTTPPIAPPFRLAAIKDATNGVQPEVRANFEQSLKVLAGFAEISEVALPDDIPYDTVVSTIISCEMAAAFEGIVTSGDVWELTAPEDRWGAHAAMVIPAKDYINAQRIRVQIQRTIAKLIGTLDALVTPTFATIAYAIDRPWREYWGRYTDSDIGAAGNAAGIPAITVPNGFGEAHLPTGLQFTGGAFEENRLIAVANAYQQATGWHKQVPAVKM